MNILFKRFINYIMICLIMSYSVGPAFANTGLPGATINGVNLQDLMVRGDVKVTKNELGNIIADLPPGETSEQIFAQAGTSPIIWGRYYQNSASGSIQASYLRRNIQTGSIQLVTENLTPSMGQRFAVGNNIVADFNGTNPFGSFVGPNGTYSGLSLQAFTSIAGMWAKHKTAAKGFIVESQHNFYGVYKWDECIKKILKACVKKRFHTEAYATVKPNWYVMAPYEVGEGHNMRTAYTAAPCLATGATVDDCQVRGGVAFIKATTGSDFPVASEKMWHHHEYKDGWAGWIIIVVTFVLTGSVGAALFAGLLNYAINGVGPNDYSDGFLGKKLDGSQVGQGLDTWSPVGCISGQSTSSGGKSGGRYGNNECKSFITGNMSNTGAGVGTFYNEKKQDPAFDWSISNDVQVLRESPTKPERIGGAPPRY